MLERTGTLGHGGCKPLPTLEQRGYAKHLTTSFPALIGFCNWGVATSILLETSWILTALPLSLELFPETRSVNLLDFLSLNQSSLVRGGCLANTYTQDTWSRSAGWLTLSQGSATTLKALLFSPLGLQSFGTQPTWSQCPASNKSP